MKNVLLASLIILFCFPAYSQETECINHATDRSVFDDVAEIMANNQEIENQRLIIGEHTENISKLRRGSTEAKKIEKEKNEAVNIITESTNKVGYILSFYFDNTASIDKFNTEYGFSLPTEISPDFKPDIHTFYVQDKESYELTPVISSTEAIDALSTFMADRFKKEINIAFLDKFKKQLDSLPYFARFFPLGKKVLDESDPYNYTVFIGTLRQAFEQDLANLKNNLPQILSETNTGRAWLDAALNAVAGLLDANGFYDFREIMNNVAQDPAVATSIPNLNKQIGLVAFSLNTVTKVNNGKIGFLDKNDLLIFKNPDFSKYFLGLLVRQNEAYLKNAGIIDLWKNSNSQKALTQIQKIANEFVNLNREIKALYEAQAQNALTEDKITKSILVLLNSIDNTLIKAQAENWFGTTVKFNKVQAFLGYAKQLNEVATYVEAKQYGLAIMNVTGFILEIAGDKLTPDQKTMLKKYSGFMADMLNAKNKEELVAALENSANPVGSYRVKRNSTFNISLNGYAGAFYGVDMKGSSVYGATAPVGIYLGYGNIGKKRPILANDDGKSFGLFLPIVDIGAVASFRLNDSETELADVSWDNVFAPGAYLTYGFGKCPISLSLGGQMGPAIKSVQADGSTVVGSKDWYWRAGIVVDIPFFDFYTKQKEYKIVEESSLDPIETGNGTPVAIQNCIAPKLTGQEAEEIKYLFDVFKSSTLFNWGDKNNCEDRANAVCKFLISKNYQCGKVWIFRKDPSNKVKNNVFINSWAFHVAAYMLDKEGDVMILDPALFSTEEGPGDLSLWASKIIEKGEGYYVFTTDKYYMHKSENDSYINANDWDANDLIEDKNSNTIKGLAGIKWYTLNAGKRKQAVWNEYQTMLKSELLYQKIN